MTCRRATVGYRMDARDWCPECVPLTLSILSRRRLPAGVMRLHRKRGGSRSCARCGEGLDVRRAKEVVR